jgi:hypothetical protein
MTTENDNNQIQPQPQQPAPTPPSEMLMKDLPGWDKAVMALNSNTPTPEEVRRRTIQALPKPMLIRIIEQIEESNDRQSSYITEMEAQYRTYTSAGFFTRLRWLFRGVGR